MNMTDQDWEKCKIQHNESMVEFTRERMTPAEFNRQYMQEPKPEPVNSEKDQVFDYIRVEKQTPKAKFFVTHETLGEIHGFWCPKAAIVVNEGKVVIVAHWCKVKTIQFI